MTPITWLARTLGLTARRGASSVRSYWSLAILALALSTALSVAISDAENPPRTDTFSSKIPIEAVNVADDLAISGGTALGGATIRITAREDVWDELTAEDFRAVADFAEAQQGDAQVPVRVELLDGDRDGDISIVDVVPGTVAARLDLRVSAVVPILHNITGQPPSGFEVGAVQLEQTEATVFGPQALVQQVFQVEADINLSGTTVDLTQSFRLVPRSRTGVTIDGVVLNPDSVVVEVEVTQTVYNREVVVKPSVTGRLATGYQVVGVSSDPPTVVVFGTQEALQTLSFVPTDAVDITGATSDVTRTVLLRLPPDLSSPSQPSVIVQVTVVPALGETELGVVPEVVDLAPEFEVTLNTPTIVVRLTGDLPVLTELRPRDLRVTVDASDLGPGIYSLEPTIDLPANVQVSESTPTEVTITITRRPPSPTPTPTETETPTSTPTPEETDTPEP